jgi:DNA-binding CsgD family transcriptional regulator
MTAHPVEVEARTPRRACSNAMPGTAPRTPPCSPRSAACSPEGRPHRRPAGAQPPLEPLSETEIRVLRYLPTNLSAPEIASELYVSPSTVKTHMHHLYAKLGTHRRGEAVARGRALGLLAPSPRRG